MSIFSSTVQDQRWSRASNLLIYLLDNTVTKDIFCKVQQKGTEQVTKLFQKTSQIRKNLQLLVCRFVVSAEAREHHSRNRRQKDPERDAYAPHTFESICLLFCRDQNEDKGLQNDWHSKTRKTIIQNGSLSHK